ncbi:TPA: hypothetical protein KO185_001806 [Clostridioides difficile]|uniref:hypothetical protein n=1 Tax=Clostridioides difficile TaxID=1496 RepID=UPI00038D3146|nr:hypothetical protein [Clostridioides difficile]EGT5080852.1 hypothetical protein [Clostridioides difficile]EGT5134766.1 hypothetical protein [Clostridioides difficile]EGT5283613.1 hypothetical protein [Clostridioides difficile]EQK00011.1 hypothetical protein QUI_3966 [Clostridioides difficile P59]MBG0193831.1 hypothetical protein [Clostridioides difficile]
MDFFINTIISGVIYDLIKKGAIITGQIIKNNLNVQLLDDTIYDEIANRINLLSYNDKNNLEKLNNAISNNKELSEFLSKNIVYKTEFAKRLDYVISLLNQENLHENVNLELLGEFLGFESVNQLKCYYNNYEEPAYKFIDNIAEKLGINKTWLKNGNGQLLYSSFNITDISINTFKDIKNKNPQSIIIALSNDNDSAKLGVILKINKFKYEYSNYLYICSNPDHGGRNKIFDIYKLIQDFMLYMRPNVYELSEADFNAVFLGKKYPGIIKRKGKEKVLWLDDFLYINYPISQRLLFENEYGQYFVECQDAIRNKLQKNSDKI